MTKEVITVAPYDNEEARKYTGFICHGGSDEEIIQYAIDVALEQKKDVQLEPGTYHIHEPIKVKGVNVSGATEGIRFETPLGEKLAEEVKSETKEDDKIEFKECTIDIPDLMWTRLKGEIRQLQSDISGTNNQSLPLPVILKFMDFIEEVYNVGRNK